MIPPRYILILTIRHLSIVFCKLYLFRDLNAALRIFRFLTGPFV